MISAVCLTGILLMPAGTLGQITLKRLPEILAELHALDWTRVDTSAVERVIGLAVSTQTAEIPRDSQYSDDPCTASVYGKANSGNVSFRFEFRQLATPDAAKCRLALYSVRLEAPGSAHDTDEALVRTNEALHASGKTCDSTLAEYRWRSDDSFTLFDLVAATTAVTGVDRKNLSIWLRHVPVSPSMVDDLPFRRGFLSPTTGAKAP